jgi:scaffold protein (connect acetoacetyl-CoA thiolase and HMG-CoA synthase)
MEERPFSDVSYQQFLGEDKLMGSRCKKCSALYVPPRQICIECYSSEMAWIPLSGRGRLAAFTVIRIPPPSMIAQGYSRKNPYCSGVVALEEGGRVDARIDGLDLDKPQDIKIGMPMKAIFLHRQELDPSETCLAFEPA